MEISTLEEMNIRERTYWWHIGKKNMVQDFVTHIFGSPEDAQTKGLKILEIGCGAGEISHVLQKYGEVYANDISDYALEVTKQKGINHTILGDITQLDLSEHQNSFDLILALDVIEHIQDDVKTLEKLFSLTKPGGVLFVNVPAYKFLWSQHDEALQHKRRYTMHELVTKVQDRGFEVFKKSHFVFFAFPGIALVKFMSNFVSQNPYPKTSYIMLPNKLNSLMVKILGFESYLMRFMGLPFGTTLTVLARRFGDGKGDYLPSQNADES